MEENQLKIIFIAVGVLFALLVIGILALGMNFGKDTFERGMGDLSDKMSSVEKARFSMFDNKEVRGSDILAFMETSKSMDATALTVTLEKGKNLVGAGYLRPVDILDGDCATNGYVKITWKEDNREKDFNTNFRLAKKAGSKFYVKPSGRYFSCLVVDEQLKPVGIAAEELQFDAAGNMQNQNLKSWKWEKAK